MRHQPILRYAIVSNLSSLTIRLNGSQTYWRLSLVLHVLTWCGLWAGHVHPGVFVLATGILLWGLWRSAISQKPYPHIVALTYQSYQWTLIDQHGEFQAYRDLQILVDAGFF